MGLCKPLDLEKNYNNKNQTKNHTKKQNPANFNSSSLLENSWFFFSSEILREKTKLKN